jgi:hypothetical protein
MRSYVCNLRHVDPHSPKRVAATAVEEKGAACVGSRQLACHFPMGVSPFLRLPRRWARPARPRARMPRSEEARQMRSPG